MHIIQPQVKYLWLSLLLILPKLLLAQEGILSEADRLFAQRDQPENLRKAIELVENLVAYDKNYEGLWRLSKYRHYLGDLQDTRKEKEKNFKAGMEAANQAIQRNDKKAEGHFWLASNTGSYAEMQGVWKSVRMLKIIRKEFETAYKIDPSYENGTAYQALGELYLRTPRLLGGNDDLGMQYLEQGVQAAPTNADLSITLAEYYIKDGKKEAARKLLEAILKNKDPFRTEKEQQELSLRARSILKRQN